MLKSTCILTPFPIFHTVLRHDGQTYLSGCIFFTRLLTPPIAAVLLALFVPPGVVLRKFVSMALSDLSVSATRVSAVLSGLPVSVISVLHHVTV